VLTPPSIRSLLVAAAAACLLVLGGCATPPSRPPEAAPAPLGVLSSLHLDRALEDRILALDSRHLSAEDVRTLAAGPAPQIILLHGGIYPVHLAMESFGEFLVAMGYPEAKIRNPGDERWSHSPYEDSAHLAGLVAWYYERDGMPPMLIGHSQGGIQAVKVLRELDGQFADRIEVWNPITDAAEDRTTIVDPLTGKERPIVGLSIDYVAAAAAGGAALLLPNQWSMIGHLRSIPNTVKDFTGYSLGLDFWAWSVAAIPEADAYRHNGTAVVRNVELPAWYNHVTFPATAALPEDPSVRAWIEDYVPDHYRKPVPLEESGRSVLWAADVWYEVKMHWCLEAQRLIRARRATLGAG